MVIVPAWTASLKVAVTVEEVATPVAPAAGVRAVMVGGVVSAGGAAAVVKLQLTGIHRVAGSICRAGDAGGVGLGFRQRR